MADLEDSVKKFHRRCSSCDYESHVKIAVCKGCGFVFPTKTVDTDILIMKGEKSREGSNTHKILERIRKDIVKLYGAGIHACLLFTTVDNPARQSSGFKAHSPLVKHVLAEKDFSFLDLFTKAVKAVNLKEKISIPSAASRTSGHSSIDHPSLQKVNMSDSPFTQAPITSVNTHTTTHKFTVPLQTSATSTQTSDKSSTTCTHKVPKIQTPPTSTQTMSSTIQTPLTSTQTMSSTIQTPPTSTQTMSSTIQTPPTSTQTMSSTIQTPPTSTQTMSSTIQTPPTSTQTMSSTIQTPPTSTQTMSSTIQTPPTSTQTMSSIKSTTYTHKVPTSDNTLTDTQKIVTNTESTSTCGQPSRPKRSCPSIFRKEVKTQEKELKTEKKIKSKGIKKAKLSQKPVYYVEKFLKEKKEDGKTFYLVKWMGYPEEENTWEPEENFDAGLIQLYKDNDLK